MLLIISIEYDQCTNEVIDWLVFNSYNFQRINDIDKIEGITIDFQANNFKLLYEDKVIENKKISSVWYRKNGLNFGYFKKNMHRRQNKEMASILKFKNNELNIIKETLRNNLREKPILGKSIVKNNLNKLEVLITAKKIGLKIPDTKITTKKDEILNGSKIIKAISEIYYFRKKKKQIITYTTQIKNTEKFQNNFFPTLFQTNIEKNFEVRVFHLAGKNYAMAIFSQNDLQTKTDFRIYNDNNPNRYVPFVLPVDIDEKINELMEELDIDTGSIDLIVDKCDDFYFLEINPVGQFGMVSLPCNYGLDKKVAEYLISLEA